jgi:hypothetical protein
MPGPEGAPVQQCTGATRLELLELTQSMQQVRLVPDQGAVKQLAVAGLHPPLHDRVPAARNARSARENRGRPLPSCRSRTMIW